jgi:hypothetical protein
VSRTLLELSTLEWGAGQRKEAEECRLSVGKTQGDRPGEFAEKGSIGLHKDVLGGAIKPEVYLTLTKIEKPWQCRRFANSVAGMLARGPRCMVHSITNGSKNTLHRSREFFPHYRTRRQNAADRPQGRQLF